MINKCLMMFLFGTLTCCAQSPLKYQLRLHVVPIKRFAYAGAARIGVETIDRKYNIGVELMSYRVDQKSNIRYSRDSVIRRATIHTNIVARGLAFNISRAYPFNGNNNRWIFVAQLFSGISRQITTVGKEIFDTSYSNFSGPRWVSQDYNQIGGYSKHGPKLNVAVSFFARLQLEISRRFTFTPELQMPFNINNYIGGDTVLDLSPGFNFCLGYRFGKEKTRKSLGQHGYNSL